METCEKSKLIFINIYIYIRKIKNKIIIKEAGAGGKKTK